MSTRERIINAAEQVMRTDGLARTTTRAIARRAGLSEGTIYNHFESKEHLFLAVLTEGIAPFVHLISQLPQQAGEEPIADVLSEIVRSALDFYGESFQMSASIFAEPRLLEHHRDAMRARGTGPQLANELVAEYLTAEQRLHHIRDDANVEAAATLLIGACHYRAFLSACWGEDISPDEKDALANDIADTILRGLLP